MSVMDHKLFHIPVSGLQLIFRGTSQEGNIIFWMRTSDYKKQIYVSETFSSTFGIPASILFLDNDDLSQFIFKEDLYAFRNTVATRIQRKNEIQQTPNNYRIVNAQGEIRQLWDQSFPIFDRKGNLAAIAGIARDISHPLCQKKDSPTLSPLGSNKFEALMQQLAEALDELKIFLTKNCLAVNSSIFPGKEYQVDKQFIVFSPRQADCINLTLQGKTMKQIARDLDLSPRTIEDYLNILKTKLNCKNKAQLIQKLSCLIDI